MKPEKEKRIWLRDLSLLPEVNVGDWVEGLGDVTTHAIMKYLRKIGTMLISKVKGLEAEVVELKDSAYVYGHRIGYESGKEELAKAKEGERIQATICKQRMENNHHLSERLAKVKRQRDGLAEAIIFVVNCKCGPNATAGGRCWKCRALAELEKET